MRFAAGCSKESEAEGIITALTTNPELRLLFLEIRSEVHRYSRLTLSEVPPEWRRVVYGALLETGLDSKETRERRTYLVAENRRSYEPEKLEGSPPATILLTSGVEAGVLNVTLKLNTIRAPEQAGQTLEVYGQVGAVQQLFGSWPLDVLRDGPHTLRVELPYAPEGELSWDSVLKTRLIPKNP